MVATYYIPAGARLITSYQEVSGTRHPSNLPIRAIEDFKRVIDRQRLVELLEMRADLHDAADVACGDRLTARAQDVLGFAPAKRLRDVGLFDVVRASRAAADIAARNIQQGHIWNAAQQLARCFGHTLRVREMTCIVVRQLDRFRQRRRRFQAEFVEEHTHIFHSAHKSKRFIFFAFAFEE